MQGGIYAITSIRCGKKYIGSAKSFSVRWAKHRLELQRGIHFSPHLQNSWSKYCESNFIFEVLEIIPLPYSRKFFFERENFHIAQAKANGIQIYNIRSAGGGGWENLTANEVEQVKKKISKRMKGVPKPEEVKERMRKAQQDRARSDPSLAYNMSSVGRLNIGRTPTNAVQFLVDGRIFPSGKAAERGLGITSRQLAKLVADGKAHRVTNHRKETQEEAQTWDGKG